MSKKILHLLFAFIVCVNTNLFTQSMNKYSFSSSISGSLQSDLNSNQIDMSSANSLFGANVDASYTTNLQDIGFEFWYMGTRYTQFSAKPDGVVRLGSIINTSGATTALSSQALICLSNTDNKTSASGSVKYKVFGTSPYQTLVVQWSGIQIPSSGTTNTNYSTFQLRLYEKTGKIEFVYGQMWNNSNASQSISAFISNGTSSGQIGAVQTIATTPAYVSNVTSAPTTAMTANSAMTNLNSSSDGSRRTFLFSPPSGFSDPNTLTFSGTSCSGTTLNWYSSSPTTNVLKYAIYNSTDNTNFTYVNTVNIGTNLYTASGLTKNTNYYWKLCAVSEGGVGSFISNSMVTLGPVSISDPSSTPQNICQNGTATSLQFNVSGVSPTYQWYYNTTNSNSGGTSISSTNNSVYTPLTTVVNSRYYYCTATSSGCSITSAPSGLVTINSLPTVSSSSGATICGSGSANITASTQAGCTIDWYSASTGGTLLLSGNSTFSTPNISSNTTYYAEARNTTTGCISSSRTGVTVSISTRPTVTSVTGATRCSSGTVQLSANGSGASTIDWYSASTGGTALVTGNTFYTTPNLSATTTYYAEARSGTCVSESRTPVIATINIVNQPSVTDYYKCDVGSVTISATPSVGETINWYTTSTGGTSLITNVNYTTPNLTSSYNTYYAESKNTTTGCVSTRIPVNIFLSYSPTNITLSSNTSTVCLGGSKDITVNGGVLTNIFVEKYNNGLTPSFESNILNNVISNTYYSEGSGSIYLTQGSGKTGYYTLKNSVDLTNSTSNVLSFKHICATESGSDYGYIEYSTNGGTSWVVFPTTSYVGSATLKNGVVSFDKTSYTNWDTKFYSAGVIPGTSPATALWKTETLNIPTGANTNNFKIRFKYTTDASSEYYGWLIDDISISGSKLTSITWSPLTDLYTDAGTTIPYNGENLRTVYSKPNSSNVYTATTTNGTCSLTNTHSITVATPIVLVVNSPTICSGNSTTLNVSGALTYLWNDGTTNSSKSITPNNTTVYTITGYDQYGCSAIKTTTVTVNTTPTISVNSSTICYGNSTTLMVSGANTYTWSNGSNTNTISVSPLSNTTYSIVGTTNGCISSQITSTVTVNSNPVVTVNSSTLCQGNSTTLTASGGSNYLWSNGSTTSSITVSPNSTSVYSVTGTNGNGCSSNVTSTVTVNSNPTIVVNSPTICLGASSTLTASGGSTYLWSNGSTSNSITVSPNSTSVYSVTGTNGNGCSSTVTSTITVNSNPIVTVNSPTIYVGSTATLTATGANTYTWSNGSNSNSITVSPSVTTTYSVIGKTNNCLSSVTSTVTVITNTNITSVGNAGPINGLTQICGYIDSPSLVKYSIADVSGAITYEWVLPDGTDIISGQGTKNIMVRFYDGFTPDTFRVTPKNGNLVGGSSKLFVTISEPPIILGNKCSSPLNSLRTYTVSNHQENTTYTWKMPYGATIVYGQGTYTCVAKMSTSIRSENLTVTATNTCGVNTSSLLIITPPSRPQLISGPTSVCTNPNNVYKYYVNNSDSSLKYNWKVPNSASLVDGQSTDTVRVVYSTNYRSGTISIMSYNECSSSPMTYYGVTGINSSSTTPTINGITNLCGYLGSSITYSVVSEPGGIYNWTIPNNFTVTSGQGTNSITLKVPNVFTSGVISCTKQDVCGMFQSSSLNLSTLSTSITVANVTASTNNVCSYVGTNNTVTYTMPTITGVSAYEWGVPDNVSIVNGQGTNKVSVKFLNGFINGTITVSVTPNCGVPIVKTILVNPNPVVGLINGFRCVVPGTTVSYTYYDPNKITPPVSYLWKAPGNATITSGQGTGNVQILYPSDFATKCSDNMCDTLSLTMNFGCSTKTIKYRIGLSINQSIVITGKTTACANNTITLTTNKIVRATSYYWNVPTGVKAIPNVSPTDTVFNFTTSSTFRGGQFGVMSVNQCQTSAYKYYNVSLVTNCTTTKLKRESDSTSVQDNITNDNEELDFIVFPNPGRNIIQLRIFKGDGKYYNVSVINTIGQVILNEVIEIEDYFDMSNYKSGVYYVTVINENGFKLTKMLIIK